MENVPVLMRMVLFTRVSGKERCRRGKEDATALTVGFTRGCLRRICFMGMVDLLVVKGLSGRVSGVVTGSSKSEGFGYLLRGKCLFLGSKSFKNRY